MCGFYEVKKIRVKPPPRYIFWLDPLLLSAYLISTHMEVFNAWMKVKDLVNYPLYQGY